MKNEKKQDAEHSRRTFMKTTAGAAAAGLLIGTSKTSWAGANDRIRCAVCGLKGRGGTHMRSLGGQPNVEIAAFVDPDESQLEMRAKEVLEKNKELKGNQEELWPIPKLYTDIRDALEEDKELNVVSIATPNHWHSLIGIWACQAGKDVYVEKPLSHNVWEGRQLVKAARKYNRIVQHGTQARSYTSVQKAMKLLKEGVIGDLYMAKGLCYKWRDTIGKTPDGPVPDGVDYDLWKGPAPDKKFSQNRFHYNWHWQWEYGNGDIGNQGVHQLDVARWGLGVDLPSKVQAMGGHFMFDDDQTTPNTLLSSMMYPERNMMLVFEVRHWITNHEGGIGQGPSNTVGNLFYGSEGYMAVEGDSYRTFLGKERKEGPSGGTKGGHAIHFENFIKAVRSRKVEDLNADVLEGHYSSALGHLANIAYRVGRTIDFDPQKEIIVGDDEANLLITDGDRDYRRPYRVPEKI